MNSPKKKPTKEEKLQEKLDKLEKKREKALAQQAAKQRIKELKEAKRRAQKNGRGGSLSSPSLATESSTVPTSSDSDSDQTFFGITTVKASGVPSSTPAPASYSFRFTNDFVVSLASAVPPTRFQSLLFAASSSLAAATAPGASDDAGSAADAQAHCNNNDIVGTESSSEDPVVRFCGPRNSSDEAVLRFVQPVGSGSNPGVEIVGIACISTYPYFSREPLVQLGDPICDYYSLSLFRNGAAFALCDGCGWGHSVRDAAKVAASCVTERLEMLIPKCRTLRDISSLLLDCIPYAHNKIVRSKDDPYAAGTTTILLGALVKIVANRRKHQAQAATTSSDVSTPAARAASPTDDAPGSGSGALVQVKSVASFSSVSSEENLAVGGTSLAAVSTTAANAAAAAAVAAGVAVAGAAAAALAAAAAAAPRAAAAATPTINSSFNSRSSLVQAGDQPSPSTETQSGSGILRTDSSGGHSRAQGPRRKYAAVFVSVGDCKAYLVHHSRLGVCKVTDLTVHNRYESLDATDCGGRIGPYVGPARLDPDLRNLSVGFVECAEGDLIVLVSDGVHDNLDPQSLGLEPREVGGPELPWSELSRDVVLQLKSNYAQIELQRIYGALLEAQRLCSDGELRVDGSGDDVDVLPSMLASSLVEHARDVTSASREFLESNPGKRQPTDIRAYPGKLDHTTCVCFRVGDR